MKPARAAAAEFALLDEGDGTAVRDGPRGGGKTRHASSEDEKIVRVVVHGPHDRKADNLVQPIRLQVTNKFAASIV
jgi:hypothetical protein